MKEKKRLDDTKQTTNGQHSSHTLNNFRTIIIKKREKNRHTRYSTCMDCVAPPELS